MNINPIIPINYDGTDCNMDLFSERFLKRREIFLFGEVNDNAAQSIIAQIQYLEDKSPDLEIYLYINSPGGGVSAGLAIADAMKNCKCDIITIGTGICASMGAFLLSCGSKGKRYITDLCEVMIHQPLLGGVQGQASDIALVANHILKIKNKLNKILAENTGKSIKKIETDSERDFYMDAQEAIKYGVADRCGAPDFGCDEWR